MRRSVSFGERVFEVICRRASASTEQYSYGSGFLLGQHILVTSAHVVAGAQSIEVRDSSKRATAAAVLHPGNPDDLDIALLRVEQVEECTHIPVALVSRAAAGNAFIDDCFAVGYPFYAERQSHDGNATVRVVEQVRGTIAPLSDREFRLLKLSIENPPAPLPAGLPLSETAWAGMSGAAVFAPHPEFAGASVLVGIVMEHAPRRGAGALTILPLERLLPHGGASDDARSGAAAQQWWALIGVSHCDQILVLPQGAADASELRESTGLPPTPCQYWQQKLIDFLHARPDLRRVLRDELKMLSLDAGEQACALLQQARAASGGLELDFHYALLHSAKRLVHEIGGHNVKRIVEFLLPAVASLELIDDAGVSGVRRLNKGMFLSAEVAMARTEHRRAHFSLAEQTSVVTGESAIHLDDLAAGMGEERQVDELMMSIAVELGCGPEAREDAEPQMLREHVKDALWHERRAYAPEFDEVPPHYAVVRAKRTVRGGAQLDWRPRIVSALQDALGAELPVVVLDREQSQFERRLNKIVGNIVALPQKDD